MQNIVEKNFFWLGIACYDGNTGKMPSLDVRFFQIHNITKLLVSVIYLAIMQLLFQHNYTVVEIYTKGD